MIKSRSQWLYYVIMMLLISGTLWAKPPKKALQIPLNELRALVDISQDLDDSTVVMIHNNKQNQENACTCACRDSLWACTETACKFHNTECAENDYLDKQALAD